MADGLSFGTAHDQILAKCARNVQLLTAIFDTLIVVCQIEGNHNNVADLSRWNNTPEDLSKLNQSVESPLY